MIILLRYQILLASYTYTCTKYVRWYFHNFCSQVYNLNHEITMYIYSTIITRMGQ